MADEHVHTWVYSIENAGVCQRDCVCGAHDQIDVPKLEQQLAQTREELRIALAQRQDYRAAATQARTLLIDWLPNEFSLRPGRAEALERRTRAFLAQHKEP